MGLSLLAVGRPVKVCFYYSTWPAAPHSQACHAYRHCMSALYVCKAQSLGACMHERPLLLLISSCSWTHQKQSLPPPPPPPRDMPPAAVQCLRPACHYSWPYGNGGGVAMKGLVAGRTSCGVSPRVQTCEGFSPSVSLNWPLTGRQSLCSLTAVFTSFHQSLEITLMSVKL